MLYALKLTPGAVSMEGVWQVAKSFDLVGVMAKSVLDLALLSDVLLRQRNSDRASLVKAVQDSWDGISVGFVDIEEWRLPPEVRGDVLRYNEQSVNTLDVARRVYAEAQAGKRLPEYHQLTSIVWGVGNPSSLHYSARRLAGGRRNQFRRSHGGYHAQ